MHFLINPIGRRLLCFRSYAHHALSKEKKVVSEIACVEESLSFMIEEGKSLPCMQTLVDLLHKCRNVKNPNLCHQLYMEIYECGLHSHEVVGNYFVPMLVECGNQSDAILAFRRLLYRNEFSWTSLIQGFIDNGELHQAFTTFMEMKQDCVEASIFTLQALAKACGRMKCIEKGRELHTEIVKEEFENDLIVGNTLVDMYAKCGCFEEALVILIDLPTHDTISWNALIAGYIEYGLCEEALRCIDHMEMNEVPLDEVTFICGLKSCRCIGDLCKGQSLHEKIIKESFEIYPGIGNCLIDLYARCGLLVEAKDVFHELPAQDVVSWNTLITNYVEHGYGEEALFFFEQMQLKGIPPDAITYISSLKGSGSIGSMNRSQKLHIEVIERGLENHSSIGNTLVDTYAKCGSMIEACEVFDKLLAQHVVSWTALISGFAEHGLGNEGIKCWEHMQLKGVSPNAITFFCILKIFSLVGALEKGLELHLSVVEEGLENDSRIGSALVDMYAKCGSFKEAEDVLDEILIRDVVLWTALIAGYIDQGHGVDSLNCLERMLSEQLLPNIATFLCSMKACGSIQAIERGQELHAMIIKNGWEKDHFLSNAIIDMYAKCGWIGESRDLFNKLADDSNVVSWNAIISGYADKGLGNEVLNLFEEMKRKGLPHNDITLVCVLKGCGSIGSLGKAQQIHSELVKRGYECDRFVGNTLIDMYAKCGLLCEAHSLFEELPMADVVSWNVLILGYVEHSLEEEALICFEQMYKSQTPPNAVTYLCTLKSCAVVGGIGQGQKIHAEIIKNGFDSYPYLGNILVDLYVKCGLLVEASHVFKMLPIRDVIVWTALISGYAESGFNKEALKYVDSMRFEGASPSSVTFLCSLKGCGNISTISIGKTLHSEIMKYGFEGDPTLGSALVDMYAKVPLMLFEAWEVFVCMPTRLIITWTSLIGAYAEHGLYEEVLDCFVKMQVLDNLSPDAIAYLDSLKACGFLGATNKGQGMHSCIVKQGIDRDEFVIGALVDMYANCGLLNEAWVVFDHKLPFPNVVPWTTLISGFAFQGDINNVFHLLEIMLYEGIEADAITLLSILTVCSHVGLVEFGCEYFQVLTKDYRIDPTIEHHNCLLDLFGRAGQLDELVTMVKDMPIQPNFISYRTVLGACKKWENLELGRHAFDCAVRLGKQQTATFVLMSNIYAQVDSDDSLILDNHGYRNPE